MRIAPATLNDWVAGLFAVGSSLFVVGSVPAYIGAVGERADAATYALGSVFFTAAAFGQLVQAQDPALAAGAGVGGPVAVPRWSWRPRDRGWLAAVTQLPGTVFFNISTFAALAHNLTVAGEDRRVWRPDVYGSVLFLVASTLGVLALGRIGQVRPRSAAWWAAWLNLVGSVAFMASAIGAYVVPDSGAAANLGLAVGGTLVGAACFLAGAVLLVPAWRQDVAAATPSTEKSIEGAP